MQSTSSVVDALRVEGFSVNLGYVQYLIRDRIIAAPADRLGGTFI